MKKLLIVTLMLILTPAFALAIEEKTLTYNEGDALYLSDCIKIAVKNSPELQKSKTKLLIAKSNVGIAQAEYFPTVGISAGYLDKINSNKGYDNGYQKRQGPSFGVYLSQLIYDFGKTSSLIQTQKFYEIAAEYDYLDKLCAIVNEIKHKYCNALLAIAVVEVEEKNVETNKQILDMTEKLYKEKKKDKVDYLNAQVYYNESLIKLEQAKNIKVKAMADLENAMYVADAPEFSLKTIDTQDFYNVFFNPEFLTAPKGQWHNITHKAKEKEKGLSDYEHLKFTNEEAYTSALANSPHLIALDAVINAMDKSVVNIKRQAMPSLKAKVGYDFDNKYRGDYDKYYTNNQLNIAITLDTAVNGMKYNKTIKRANLMVDSTKSDYEIFRQGTYFKVKKYYSDVITAENQLGNSKEKVKKAIENLELVNDLYATGEASYIELHLARNNVNMAKLNHIKIVYEYNTALANLERQTNRQIDYIVQYSDIPLKLKGSKK